MKWSKCALVLLVGCTTGCGLIRDGAHNLLHEFRSCADEFQARTRNERLANEAWREVQQANRYQTFSRDYEEGFRAGFMDLLDRGGNGEPPVLPPKKYWRTQFQSPAGQHAVEQWFAGFRHGSSVARESGYRDWMVMPMNLTSLRAQYGSDQPRVPPPNIHYMTKNNSPQETKPNAKIPEREPLRERESAGSSYGVKLAERENSASSYGVRSPAPVADRQLPATTERGPAVPPSRPLTNPTSGLITPPRKPMPRFEDPPIPLDKPQRPGIPSDYTAGDPLRLPQEPPVLHRVPTVESDSYSPRTVPGADRASDLTRLDRREPSPAAVPMPIRPPHDLSFDRPSPSFQQRRPAFPLGQSEDRMMPSGPSLAPASSSPPAHVIREVVAQPVEPRAAPIAMPEQVWKPHHDRPERPENYNRELAPREIPPIPPLEPRDTLRPQPQQQPPIDQPSPGFRIIQPTSGSSAPTSRAPQNRIPLVIRQGLDEPAGPTANQSTTRFLPEVATPRFQTRPDWSPTPQLPPINWKEEVRSRSNAGILPSADSPYLSRIEVETRYHPSQLTPSPNGGLVEPLQLREFAKPSVPSQD